MPLPHSKQELADWILRRLGAPLVNVEIADVQLEDVIDEAVQFFQEYHYDGAERAYRVIKIAGDVLHGNNRRHQELTAQMYDISNENTYRVGDRVMTYKDDGTPNKIWTRVDSDESVTHKNYTLDPNGDWFVKDSDILLADLDFLHDSQARFHTDSEGVYVAYDSETHTTTIYYPIQSTQFFYSETSNAYKPDSNSFVLVGDAYVQYDSDTHAIYQFDSDDNGIWTDSDGTFVLFDSDKASHTVTTYVPWDSDADVRYVLIDGSYVVYDSDVHAVGYIYTQDAAGSYVREEGTMRFVADSTDPVYQLPGVIKFSRAVNNPDLYEQRVGDKQKFSRQKARPVNVYIATEETKYVDSDGTYVVYDADKHFTLLEDSEGLYVIDSDGAYVVYDSDRHAMKFLMDSDGTHVKIGESYVQYDSESHTSYVYDSEDLGPWTLTDVGYELYDSDTHTNVVYTQDATGMFVMFNGVPLNYDPVAHAALQRYTRATNPAPRFIRYTTTMDRFFPSNYSSVVYEEDQTGAEGYFVYDVNNNVYVPYDSELYSVITYESDAVGAYVNTNGIMQIYSSDTYAIETFDSDSANIATKSDLIGKSILFRTDSEDYYETYDSDRHHHIFMDSDSDGNMLTFRINFDRVFANQITFQFVQRFKKVSRSLLVQRYHRVYQPYTRYWKNYNVEQFYRRDYDLGNRYSLTLTKETRPIGTKFEDYWKEENVVLNEPKVDYDYSKTGQVGIPVPETIIGINKMFRIDNFSGSGMWNYEYQYFMSNFDFFFGNGGASSMPMSNYMITKSYMDLIDNMMNVQPAIRFNKTRNRLYIDTNWTRIERSAKNRDYYLMIECYEVNDPEVFGGVYKEKWLKRYATALAKMQWGSNLKKYTNTELPGGLTIDGQALYDEGKEEAEKLEEELKSSQLEMDFLIG